MRYTHEITVNAPIDRVVEVFNNPANAREWHPDLVSQELLEGESRQAGARTEMIFISKRGEFHLIETVTVNDLPREFSGGYETVGKGIFNTMTSRFEPIGEGSTHYEVEIDYEISGFKMKAAFFLMGRMIRRQSYRSLELFKEFVEREA